MIERGIEFLLFLSPLVLGSNRPIFWAINALIACIVLGGFALAELRRQESTRFDWSLLVMAGAGLAILVCWMILQALPCVPSALAHPIWTMDKSSGCGTISINPSLTWTTVAWMSSVAIAIPAARLGASKRRTMTVLNWFFGVSTAIALFGIVTEAYSFATVGLREKTAYLGWVTGTFVNRNTAATYFGLGLIVGLTLLTTPDKSARVRRSSFLVHLLNRLLGRDGFVYAGVAVLYAALLLTGSRAGIVSSSLGALVVFILRASSAAGSTKRWALPVMLLGAFVTITAGLALLWRADTAVDSNVSRLSLYKEALEAIADRPLLGHGAGTYPEVQPLYHAPATPPELVWGHAHSVYLEAAATLGLPMTVFALILLGIIFFKLLRAHRLAAATNSSAIVAALAASVALALHSAVDFSLQTQAVTIAYSTLMGLAIGERMLVIYDAFAAEPPYASPADWQNYPTAAAYRQDHSH